MFASLWVVAATAVAMLPMRLQFPPGIVLLISAPVLIVWLGHDYGWHLSVLAFAGFASMFRNPIKYYWRRWTGREVQE
ncbi:DUF2484 family protein [Ruegeria sp. MALMAid1280]|uniref:DUF2484 family protein n=1 Tax=Ruegeria sp. MALMAid1280 TaxID=3411634 RepID=UPI003BA17342